ncbi:Tyrosine recombinase XerC [Fusobacterium sp. DD29]|uniref:tyrosine-type recombinase/integrase n=1 Tax=unclassified Fusobacterium TaxID=2648384 RepID=UPI001B8BEAB9|nr:MULTISPECIES: tyrosine-type recombinase/integrase [unclassified Fusobacterium]MBR8700283.1 Tyrosine recombinase XerC [Fusobacterium sp. DD45]MBR8710462.1 Tyrosine recombinase XerC [Fusobacterium sp. DD28]MBR8748934.1 Tyrosine recombinase XerC [Fusobacterium sp. DD29]MBR8751088.1 Tyrosine recombinase XerC [Fusobacterium sp. DD26]MBR8761240.1 Tyrosine recombinase XerC [Fusobacterium sp. DD25]
MRNPNGFGCVYKFNPKFKKLRKPWVAKASVNIQGERQKQKTIGYYATKAEALEALIAYQKDPAMLDNAKITVDDVYKLYMKEQEMKVSESRYKNIGYQYNHFEPIKNLPITSLTPMQLQAFMDGIKRSTATKSMCKSILKGIYKQAMKMQIVTEDPTNLLEIGKHEDVIQRKVFSYKEREYLWNNLDTPIAKHLIVLIYTGMRIQEYLKLRLKDYDQTENTIRTGSKTEAGKNRLIPVHSKIRTLLLNILINRENEVSYAIFRRRLIAFCKDNNTIMQEHTIHDTRHTFASMLSAAGANEVAVTRIIGHTDIATTNKVYVHKELEDLKNAVELLN